MSFSSPFVLLLLVVPVALAVWEWRRAGHRVRVPVDMARSRRRPVMGVTLKLAAMLPAVLLACVIVILAGPKRMGPPGQARMLTNIELCLDVSGSMSSPIAGGRPKFKEAIAAIEYFTKRREGDAMGLTIFGLDTVRWVPLTRDVAAIRLAAPFIDPDTLPGVLGGTAVARAVRYCRDVLLLAPEGDRLIVLISDGQSADLTGGAAAQLGAELSAQGVVVYTIHVDDSEIPGELHELTNPTGGRAFKATNEAAFASVFAHIDEMHKIKTKPTQAESVDAFGGPVVVAIGALGTMLLTLFGVRYTPW
jgi:Ca-activated chloride channel family protein